MTFYFDIVLLIIAIFMFFSGLYFGFYNQLRRTLSSIAGLAAAIFTNDLLVGIISSIGNIKEILAKVVNIFFVMDASVAVKLLVGLVTFLVTKLLMYLIIGIFKKRDVKSFLKDKSTLSCVIGGILGLVNAYIAGLMLYILFFNIPSGLDHASISQKIFYILPHIKELVDIMAASSIAY